jgi:hypothetical protein
LATERQISANRANAKKSTGPRTATGKAKSSRNAYRHGLSVPQEADIASLSLVHAVVDTLPSEQMTEDRLAAAKDFALAQAALARIQAIRASEWVNMDPNRSHDDELRDLKGLASLDRYERYARTKRRLATKKLKSER